MNKDHSLYQTMLNQVREVIYNFCCDFPYHSTWLSKTKEVLFKDGFTSLIYDHSTDEYIIKCGNTEPCVLVGKHAKSDDACLAFVNWV